MTNNWKLDANPFLNPFGNAIVVAIGAAVPAEDAAHRATGTVLALDHERFENYRAVVTGNEPCVTYAHGLCRGTIGLAPSLHHH